MTKKLVLRGVAVVLAVLVLGVVGVVSNWKAARAENSFEGYALAAVSPISGGAHEDLDWLAASKEDSIHSYVEFLRGHPSSAHIEEMLKRVGPRIDAEVLRLAQSVVRWSENDRDLNRDIHILNPNNPFPLYLAGLDEAHRGLFDDARANLKKAGAAAGEVKINDLAMLCNFEDENLLVEDPYPAGPQNRAPGTGLEVVTPLWEGPVADLVRRATLSRVNDRNRPELLFVTRENCLNDLLAPSASSGSKSPWMTFEYWIDFDAQVMDHLQAQKGR